MPPDATTSPSGTTAPQARLRTNRREAILLVLLFAWVCGYYFWAIQPERGLFSEPGNPRDYYNLLIDGFRSGHTYLATDPDPRLAKLADPYDPAQNAPYQLHDAAYFQGHFYLYFGVTPAVTLFLPCALLTGRYLSDTQVIWIDACISLGFALGLLFAVRRRFFPEASGWHLLTAGLALGFCTMIPALLARPSVWEVPISSGYACLSASLFFLFAAAYGRRPLLALSLSSLCYGLAIGSRPTYAFGAAMLLVPAWMAWRSGAGRAALLRRLAAAVLPITAVVLGLLAYNQARFGSPFDFGFHYQMTGIDERARVSFSPRYLGFDGWVYLFSRAQWSPYFPFVRMAALPPLPTGYLGVEDPFGIFPNLPITLFALALAWSWPRLRDLRPYVAGLLATLTVVTLTVFMFGGATNRYMVDFVPLWTMAGAIGVLARVCLCGFRRLVNALWSVFLAVSVAFGIFSGLGHNELLRVSYPTTYRALAHALDYPARVASVVTGKQYKPLTLRVMLPSNRQGKLEPLLVSGVGYLSDYIYLLYASKDSIIVGFEHTGQGGPTTQPIPIDYHKPHEITLEAGFLLPPKESPYFDRVGPEAAEQRRLHYKVIVDGVSYLTTSAPSYDPAAFSPLIGRSSPDRPAFGPAFTGRVLSVRDYESTEFPPVSGSPLRLGIVLPPFIGPHAEPIVTTGVTGAGDSLYIQYVDPVHIELGFDHWGKGGPLSAPIAIDPSRILKLTVSLGSFYPGPKPVGTSDADWKGLRGRLFVSLNDQVVFDENSGFFPATEAQIAVGRNPIGTSSSNPAFTGRIVSQARAALFDLDPSQP